jgi:hypothetical protein
VTTHPCVRSGYCCKVAPCSHGEVTSADEPACRFLEVEREVADVPIYRCGKYEEIKGTPFADFSPAFGGGCSSPMFNEARNQVILALAREAP